MNKNELKETFISWLGTRIIVHKDEMRFDEILLPLEELEWRQDVDSEPYLTLGEISDQLEAKGYQSPFYVWHELSLHGTIYLYGNYEPKRWEKHGTTRGYA